MNFRIFFIISALLISVLLNTDIIYVDAFVGGKAVLGYPSAADGSGSAPHISAKSAALVDASSGEILYAKNMAAKIPLASITKLMSLSVIAERNLNWDEVVGMEDSDVGNLKAYVGPGDKMSLLGLGAGSEIKLRDLICAALIKSANDAMAAAVRAAGFNFFAFAKEMNDRALQLGMLSTEFDEPTGLSINNVTTAGDLVLLAESVFENKVVQEITSLKSYGFDAGGAALQFDSTNKLFGKLASTDYKIIAGKTGFVEESGYNLLVEVENGGGKRYIIVILGAASDENRFEDAYKLIRWADAAK